MNKGQFIEALQKKAGLESKAQAGRVLDAFVDLVKESLSKGEEVAIAGLGSFRVKERKARMGINPKTGERIQIPAKRVPKFKPAKDLKQVVS